MTTSTPIPSINWTILLKWVLACTLGWLAGWALLDEILIGVTIGLAQWLVLRNLYPQSAWWIVASALGWLAGWGLVVSGVIISGGGGFLSSFIAGMVIGALTGLAQWLLLRRWVPLSILWITANAAGWALGFAGLLGGTMTGAVVGVITGLALEWLLRNAQRLTSPIE